MLLAVIIFLFLAVLIGGICIRFRIKFCMTCFHFEFFFKIFRVELPFQLRIRIEWSQEDGVFVFLLKKSGEPKVLSELGKTSSKKKNTLLIKGILSEAKHWFVLENLAADGCVGIKDDAFECVMLTGFLKTALESSFCIMLNSDEGQGRVRIRPNFNIDLFLLNLEGMFRIRPVQIITAALKWYFAERGFGNYGSSHREHHENNYGADQTDGGC